MLKREERFGYLELAEQPSVAAKDFIQCSFEGGTRRVTFSVLSHHDLESGKKLGA